jgi:hypothetical protein
VIPEKQTLLKFSIPAAVKEYSVMRTLALLEKVISRCTSQLYVVFLQSKKGKINVYSSVIKTEPYIFGVL